MLESVFQPIADAAGAHDRLHQALHLSFFSLPFPWLPSSRICRRPQAKHLYSLMISFIFFVPILNLYGASCSSWIALVTYFICMFKVGGKDKWAGWCSPCRWVI